MAEYSLESSRQPIGISEYNLSINLPKDYESILPTIEEIEFYANTDADVKRVTINSTNSE